MLLWVGGGSLLQLESKFPNLRILNENASEMPRPISSGLNGGSSVRFLNIDIVNSLASQKNWANCTVIHPVHWIPQKFDLEFQR